MIQVVMLRFAVRRLIVARCCKQPRLVFRAKCTESASKISEEDIRADTKARIFEKIDGLQKDERSSLYHLLAYTRKYIDEIIAKKVEEQNMSRDELLVRMKRQEEKLCVVTALLCRFLAVHGKVPKTAPLGEISFDGDYGNDPCETKVLKKILTEQWEHRTETMRFGMFCLGVKVLQQAADNDSIENIRKTIEEYNRVFDLRSNTLRYYDCTTESFGVPYNKDGRIGFKIDVENKTIQRTE